MSEHPHQRLADEYDSISFGSVTLVYNDELLELIGADLLDISDTKQVSLAVHDFPGGVCKHIKNASFGLRKYSKNESASLGQVTFNTLETSPRRVYNGPDSILREMAIYFEKQIFFNSFDLSFTGDKLIITNDIHTFSFTMTSNPSNAFEVTLSNEVHYDSIRPLPEDILAAASSWAQMCEYVVQLGVGALEAIPLESATTIVLGQLKEYPSDIEIALVQELENRRLALGSAATLPNFDDTDILSADNQRMIAGSELTPDELVATAKTVIDKKRMEYATLEIMTEITQSDIVNALREALAKRE